MTTPNENDRSSDAGERSASSHSNPELLQKLRDLRHGDPGVGDYERLAEITVRLDLSSSSAQISERWIGEQSPERKQWLSVYAGIITCVRFAAFFQPEHANPIVVALTHAAVEASRTWALVPVGSEPFETDIELVVELVHARPAGLEGDFLSVRMPEDLEPRDAIDAAVVLRDHLCGTRSGPIPGVATAGYNVIGSAATNRLFDATSIEDQIVAPLLAMQVLERSGLVWPIIGLEPLVGMDGKAIDTSDWDQIQLGYGAGW
ncbi:MAG: hypothetical protein ACPGWS_09465 [Solirubrobacterales bacterium]